MSEVTNIWDARRIKLAGEVKKAVLALLAHTDSDCLMLVDIDPNDPMTVLLAGNKESLRHLIDHESTKA